MTWIYKDSFILRYPSKYQFMTCMRKFDIGEVGHVIPLLILCIESTQLPIYISNINENLDGWHELERF